ncbi:hypothetical protein ACMVA5_000024 [Yersinia enterocolitica]
MALTLLSANNASTVLAAGISASATTLTVNTGTGGLFPSPVSGTSFFKLTLIDAATGTLTEIVHVTARTGDTMTIVRGQEGTVSRLWSANDIAANMMTAGTLDLFAQSGTLGGAALLNVGTTAGTVAAGNDNRITGALQKSANLSDLQSTSTARTNLGLGGAAVLNVGTTVGTVAAGDDPRITASLLKANNLSDLTNVPAALLNLGLGVGSFPIGMPFFWPSATLPNLLLPEWSNMVFLKFNNSTFSATTYPKLAKIFPSLVLPDARGNFPRIWDDGRGVDVGRALMSEQGDAIRNFSGYIDAVYGQAAANRDGPFYNNLVSAERYNTTRSSGVDAYMNISFEPGRVVPVANENRPVNIAFNLLVRAA